MTTLDDLEASGRIKRVRIQLAYGRFETRRIFATPDCLNWMKAEVPRMTTGRIASAKTPREQLMDRLIQWIVGDPMHYGRMFKDLRPQDKGVWELKTDDLRIFGWLHDARTFVAVCGGYTDDYKEPTKKKHYGQERDFVFATREEFGIPCFQGVDYD